MGTQILDWIKALEPISNSLLVQGIFPQDLRLATPDSEQFYVPPKSVTSISPRLLKKALSVLFTIYFNTRIKCNNISRHCTDSSVVIKLVHQNMYTSLSLVSKGGLR